MRSFLAVILLFLTSPWGLLASESKIWFEGDRMPGTNKTVGREPLILITPAPPPPPPFLPPILAAVPFPQDQLASLATLPKRAAIDSLISRGLVNLALGIQTVAEPLGPNLVFSPLSIASAMALILLGAKGSTKSEVAHLLGLAAGIDLTDRNDAIHRELGRLFGRLEKNPGVDIGTDLESASGIFVQQDFPIKPKFMDVARSVYRSEVLALDFTHKAEEARLVINKWVSNRTDGRIKDIISKPLSSGTRVVIANALYFNGEWESPFLTISTKERPFYVSSTKEIQIPMMVNGAEAYYMGDPRADYKVLGLPYKGREVIFYIVIPTKMDLKFFAETLSVDVLFEIINSTSLQNVIYTVPRMHLESTLNLNKPLRKLGVTSLFDSSLSDLSGIADGVFASDVFHKVDIEVTETGTVASAATGITLTRDGATPMFRTDRPFLFFIYHTNTKIVPFWGTVFEPTPSLK